VSSDPAGGEDLTIFVATNAARASDGDAGHSLAEAIFRARPVEVKRRSYLP